MSVCQGTKRDGTPCTLPAMAGSEWCWNHDPARAEERSRNAFHAATTKHSSVGKELREVRELIWELLGLTITDQLSLGVRKRLTEVVQLLQCYLRAAEVEMRAAEEPLKSGLDVKGLKAQVLERIETLEEREREREALLSQVMAVADEHGLDAGAFKAVMGG
jgi:hypothetical protein